MIPNKEIGMEEILRMLDNGEIGPDLDKAIRRYLHPTIRHRNKAPKYSIMRDFVGALIEVYLPGWWYSSGHCYLTCHASIGPDHNDPAHSERLHKEFPPNEREEWDSGIHADLRQPTTEAAALLHCFIRALDLVCTHTALTSYSSGSTPALLSALGRSCDRGREARP